MKRLSILLLLCLATVSAQEKKYQSLLWEVSGNGLEKNSYLYGSMHVSDKVSYHLSDAFFQHLLEADMVANESEPSTWIDLYGVLSAGGYDYYAGNFYSQFYLAPLSKEQMYPLFYMNNFTMNNLLFRTNEYQKEYQEETYLDMFIYRTGRKYNKKTVGLEDTKTSLINIMNADLSNARPKEENMAALQKILKNNQYEEVMMNFYREKDLDMIDSLTVLSTSEDYLKALLYDRNTVMVKSIDSLAQKGSLFAAVGAAHLPGKKGIIEMLRKKGYTVTPVFDSYTEEGKAKKQQIEEFFIKPAYQTYTTADSMIELPVHRSIIENGENIESPDLANGGYINVKRLPLLDFLKKDNSKFNHKSLDSLFYENIPGKILEKKFYRQDGYDVYDIKSITKTGNAQRYKYFITPLEIIVVSMAGEEDYTRRFEDEVYSKIKVKPVTSEWKKTSPKRGGFSVLLPSYTIIYGDMPNAKTIEDIEMYAYDSNDNANYFLLERTLTENEKLENSAYELKRIHYEFYNQFDIDSTQTRLTKQPLGFTSASSIGNKTIRLKTFIDGPKYYLLGSVGANENNTEKFFNSFEFIPSSGMNEFRTYKDTTASFAIDIPKPQNERLDFESKNPIKYPNEKINDFREKNKNYSFTLPSGETVNLWYKQAHRYEKIQVIDSVWTKLKKAITTNENDMMDEEGLYADDAFFEESVYVYSGNSNNPVESVWHKILANNPEVREKTEVKDEKTFFDEKTGAYRMDFLATDINSEQALKCRVYYKNGRYYLINTLVAKDYKKDNPYIEKIFDSFTITEDKTEALPENKVRLFIEDAKSQHDSIRYSALKSVYSLKLESSDIADIEAFAESFNFKADETDALTTLYEKIGSVKDEKVIPFLEKQYKKEGANTLIQFAVLKALTYQETEEAYEKIMELLEHDLPLSDNEYEIASLFYLFEKDIENSAVLFPDIFQFYSIQEYHDPIVSYMATLLEKGSIKPKKLKNYKKMVLTNAKLEYKRVKSRKAKAEAKETYNRSLETSELKGYIALLYPFKNEKDIKPFFDHITELDIKETNLEMARLDIADNNLSQASSDKLLKNPETAFTVYNMLYKNDPDKISKITGEDVAASGITILNRLNKKKDSLVFIEKRIVPYYKNKISFYFFRVKHISSEDDSPYDFNPDKIAGIAFVNDDDKINPRAFRKINPEVVVDEDETEKYIKRMIDASINYDKTRASFGKTEDDYMPYDEYGMGY